MVRRVISIIVCVALAVGAFAGSAGAKKLTKGQKAKVRAELRKQVKKNPGAVKRRSFLRRAALVNFKLPVTIRLRNPCTTENGQNPQPTVGGNPVGVALSTNCLQQGTALNQRTVPSADVNLGPSLGTRAVAIGGALAAVVEFQDTYDGGALGNVNIKILPGNKTLTTSSVPLLWNDDIADTAKRSDANWLKSLAHPGGALAALQPFADGTANQQGCGDWTTTAGEGGTYAGAPAGAGYKALFYDVPADFGSGTGAGLPGYQVYTSGGSPSGVFLPINAGVDDPANLQAGGVIGNNDWIGLNPNPFPTGSAPTNSGNPAAPTPFNYNAANTVLRTTVLSLGIAPGGVSVDMSTGTPTSPGGLPSAQGSQDVTLGYSGGQANLFGNIPGKSVGIDVTVNLQTRINAIARIVDHDVFKQPGLIEGEDFPAAYYNCRQILTGSVQNYIPGVRLTGSLRIAPAITKDGKVRIAKATVSSDANNPDRVALSACLFPSKPFNTYAGASTDASAAKIPSLVQVTGGGASQAVTGGTLQTNGNTNVPFLDAERYPNLAEGFGPSTVPCGSDSSPDLADIIRKAGLTGTVAGLPTPTDPAFAGVGYKGNQATVAGDITVNPIEVDVLLGDQPVGT